MAEFEDIDTEWVMDGTKRRYRQQARNMAVKRQAIPTIGLPAAHPELEGPITTRALVLPGSNYIGPLNPLRGQPALSGIDYAAYQHDIDPRFRYFQHNEADEEFMQRLRTADGPDWQRNLALGYHTFKKAVFPHTRGIRERKDKDKPKPTGDLSSWNKKKPRGNVGRRMVQLQDNYRRANQFRVRQYEGGDEKKEEIIPPNFRKQSRQMSSRISKYKGGYGKPISSKKILQVSRSKEHFKALSTTQCQYIAHCAFGVSQVVYIVASAFVKSIFACLEVQIREMDDLISSTWWADGGLEFKMRYYASTANNISSDNQTAISHSLFTVTGPISYWGLASSLYTMFTSNTLGQKEKRHYIDLKVTRLSSPTENNSHELLTIDLQNCVLHIDTSSTMKFQNLTKAGGNVDVENAENIKANPLVCYVYETAKWNGFQYRYRDTPNLAKNIVLNQSYKFIEFGHYNLSSQKPPPAWHFGLKHKPLKFYLQPGEIKKSSLRKTFQIKFQTFFSQIADGIGPDDAIQTPRNYPFGPARMFAMEHLIKQANDPNIELAVQIDNYEAAYVTWTNKTYTMHQQTVDSNPLGNEVTLYPG